MKKAGKKTGIILAVIIGPALAAVLALLIVLTVTEYQPADVEKVDAFGRTEKQLHAGDTVDIVSWNIGFGALGDNADFFMDGGKMVKPSTKERVQENIEAVTGFLAEESADIVLMRSDLLDVSTAVQLSRAVIRNIKQNLFWAFFYNAIGIPIAAGVFYPAFQLKMNPMLGALAMSFSSVFVVSNALRLRWFKAKHTEAAPKTVSSPSDRGVEIASKEIMASNEKGETNMEKVISIEGMACMHCVNHVQQALSAVPGVKEAKVDLESKSATVSVDGNVTDAALKAAVDEAGYQAVSIR